LHVRYDAVWAPTAHHSTLRLLFSVAVELDFDICHIDVKCAFLNKDLQEQVYIEQPEVLKDGNPHNVWFLYKALYGVKQAGRQWHLHLYDVLISLRYKRAGYDPALFISPDTRTSVLMCTDDLFIFGSPESCSQLTTSIMSKFETRDFGGANGSSFWAWPSHVTRKKGL
jgi:hypothetical protein